MNPYTENGYENRKHYLQCMSEDWGVPFDVVCSLSSMLGPNEDFDGLINALEDTEGMFDEE